MDNASTQQFIEIAGIQDGVVVLKSGGYRMIFSVSALNFSLKSEQEQNSLIFQYQSFLNSLHFPIQIVMRSKRLDLQPYIKKINEQKDKQTSELIKSQTEDYLDFISELINLANIMKKTFYVIVPYDPVTVKSGGIVEKLFKKSEPANFRISGSEFNRYKDELTERANTVATGLGSMGLHCVQLTTEEIIELFYKIYNPDIADKERFSNVDELTASYVATIAEKKGDKEEASEEEEERIDNSAIVEEKQKQETQLKEMAADKEGEKQIAKTPSQKETPPPPQNATAAPNPSIQSSAPVATQASAPTTATTPAPAANPNQQNPVQTASPVDQNNTQPPTQTS